MRVSLARASLVGVLLLTLMGAGCFPADQSDGILRLAPVGSTVFVDALDESADIGDQALLERNPQEWWTLPEDARFSFDRVGPYQVEVVLDKKRGFVVRALNGTPVGPDHDACLQSGSVQVEVDVPAQELDTVFEQPAAAPDTSDDDCVERPAA